MVDSCQALGKSCQHLNFYFPCKTEHFYWLRTKELCWEASAVSFNFFFIFLSSSRTFAWIFSAASKMCKNSNVLDTLPEHDISRALFFQILTSLRMITSLISFAEWILLGKTWIRVDLDHELSCSGCRWILQFCTIIFSQYTCCWSLPYAIFGSVAET